MDEQPGYTPEEIERGEDRSWHIPAWGCLAATLVLMVGCYVRYCVLIWIGFSGSISF
jgi:hypothetical protein